MRTAAEHTLRRRRDRRGPHRPLMRMARAPARAVRARGGPRRRDRSQGTSDVAAGMLAPVTEADFGEEGPLRVNMLARERWPAFAAELEEVTGLSTGYRDSGALVVAADRDDAEALRRLHEFQRSLGLDAEWLTPSRCRELEPGLSPRIAGGIAAPQDGSADPRATVRALAAVAGEVALGVDVHEIEHDGSSVSGVRTAAGTIECEQVVVAAGPWSASLAPSGEGPPVRPVKGQIIELRARGGDASAVRAGGAHAALLPREPGRRARRARSDGGGAGLRHGRHGRRRLPAARGGLGGAARGGRARAGGGARRPAAGHARQRSRGRRRASSTG